MECPYCNYTHGFNADEAKNIVGENGGFFKLSNDIKMIRRRLVTEERELYACPSCYKTFIAKAGHLRKYEKTE